VSNLINEKKILDVIFICAKELNKQLPENARLICKKSTVIIGNNSVLDSLGIVTLIVSVEEHFNKLGVYPKMMEMIDYQINEEHPFSTMGSMADWIQQQTLTSSK